uniref:Peptidase M12B domain-containing protein n=1 Tax=Argulus foliaceus TaxID=509924 RepID=A0A7R9S6Y2_9CRUS
MFVAIVITLSLALDPALGVIFQNKQYAAVSIFEDRQLDETIVHATITQNGETMKYQLRSLGHAIPDDFANVMQVKKSDGSYMFTKNVEALTTSEIQERLYADESGASVLMVDKSEGKTKLTGFLSPTLGIHHEVEERGLDQDVRHYTFEMPLELQKMAGKDYIKITERAMDKTKDDPSLQIEERVYTRFGNYGPQPQRGPATSRFQSSPGSFASSSTRTVGSTNQGNTKPANKNNVGNKNVGASKPKPAGNNKAANVGANKSKSASNNKEANVEASRSNNANNNKRSGGGGKVSAGATPLKGGKSEYPEIEVFVLYDEQAVANIKKAKMDPTTFFAACMGYTLMRYKSVKSFKIDVLYIGLGLLHKDTTSRIFGFAKNPMGDQSLNKFAELKRSDSKLFPPADVLVYATGIDMATVSGGRMTLDLRGIAFFKAVCKEINLALVEVNGDFTNFNTYPHELAHSLGSPHDGEGNSGTGSCLQMEGHIMSYEFSKAKDKLLFSDCSEKTMKDHLFSENAQCVFERSAKQTLSVIEGDYASLLDYETNCRMKFPNYAHLKIVPFLEGYDSFPKIQRKTCDNTVCFFDKAGGMSMAALNTVPYEGSLCAPNKYCKGGVCQ